ncbi:HYR domain-containing protein [Flavobacterium rhamnosiphilum]|uniref:HYR domain-containing protein n=1 Tax=Flavobacterium rhamnosiphilum TaxID=2541724 RepID=A0A4R5F8Z1_9FLAO|nr:HYR domain-containing protein [Flavobacterium rhamnosiphilum]TDE44339.1 HYR domain-containing protein [Flavobacterium rhamnosiphilum]
MKKLYINTFLTLVCILVASFSVCAQVSNWNAVGPIAFPTNDISQINGIARVSQIKFDPVSSSKIYAVAPHGLFVSNDNANTWNVLPGTENLVTGLSLASVCIDKTNTNTLYLGTGDADYYSGGSGVWKSTDGGTTFVQSNTGMGSKLVREILMSPTDNTILVAATNSGIYKSTDAGSSWVLTSAAVAFSDMRMNAAAGSTTIYAIGRTNGVFYKSTDMGSTWTSQTVEATTPGNGARLAVTPADANVVYLTFIGSNTSTGGIIYKSSDGGATFTMQKGNVAPNLNGYNSSTTGQGNYNYDMEADPNNANTLYVVGHLIWKSTNGGVTWAQMTPNWASIIHTDMHGMRFNPYNTSQLFNVNDGGVWLNTDGTAKTWTPKSEGLSGTEFYRMGNSPSNKYMIGGGLQDNGAVYFKNGVWRCYIGGDYTSAYYFDKSAASKVYNAEWGTRRDLYNSATTAVSIKLPNASKKPDLYAFSNQNENAAFVAQNTFGIYATANLQSNPPTWTKILSSTNTFLAMAISPTDANVVYALSNNKSVVRSTDALSATPTFATVASALMPSGTPSAGGLAVLESGVVYMSSGGYVYRSDDQGSSWTAVGTGAVTTALNAQTIKKIIADTTHTDTEVIYAYTNKAVFYKDNTLTDWAYFTSNLPSVANLTDLDIFYDTNNLNNSLLRVSSYGRGVWESPLAGNTIVNQAPTAAITSPYNNQAIEAGSNLMITNNIADPNGFITKIEYYQGSTLIGKTLDSTSSFIWNNVPAGNYALTVKATDNHGVTTTSSIINIKVGTLVTIGSATPVADAYVRNGTTYESTNYGTANGLVVKNDNNSGFKRETYLKFDLSSLPTTADNVSLKLNVASGGSTIASTNWQVYYVPTDSWTETGITWNNKPAPSILLSTVKGKSSGTAEWDITHQAISELGADKILSLKIVSTVAGGTSDAIFRSKEDVDVSLWPQIITRVLNAVPTVSITSPANNAIFTEGENVTINADAVDTDGTISKVEFYQGSTLLGESTAAPYSFIWNSVAAGTYVLTAKATDNNGDVTTSSATDVTVRDITAPVITCPTDIIIESGVGQCGAIADFLATATDNFSNVTINYTVASGTFLLPGITSITATATDEAGNSSNCTFTVTVKDVENPAITCPDNITINNDAGDCGAIVNFAATATDNCEGITISYDKNPDTLFPIGTTTVTATATDVAGNSSSCEFTVIVNDTQTPVITSPTDIVMDYDAANCGKVIYAISAEDNCSTSLTRTAGLGSGEVFPVGTTTETYEAIDPSGNSSSVSFTVTVNKAPTTSTLIVPATVQYSDKAGLTARIAGGANACGGGAVSTVTFNMNGVAIGTVPMTANGDDLMATLTSQQLLDAPGTIKNVTATFNGVDNTNYAITNNPTAAFTITKEDAGVHYSGALFVSTTSANSGSANVTLKATVRDITAETGSSLFDANAGDIRNATATFINRDNNMVIAANVPLVLATPGDTKTGIATFNWVVNIGNANSQNYTIGVIVNNYYTHNSSADNAVITVSKPLNGFITGGGNLVVNNSAGIMASDANSLNSFGFGVIWNKTKTSLQGSMNTIIRHTENGIEKIYQIKSNSISTLVTDTNITAAHPYSTATFGAKANIQDITNPLAPISIDGNATLQVTMTDGSSSGATDKIGITVWNKNGSLWYSNNWTGSTEEQAVNEGEVIINRNPANTAKVDLVATDMKTANIANGLTVKVYPNPSTSDFKLDVQSNGTEELFIRVIDVNGQLVAKINSAVGKSIEFGQTFAAGVYFVEIRQGADRTVVKLIKL